MVVLLAAVGVERGSPVGYIDRRKTGAAGGLVAAYIWTDFSLRTAAAGCFQGPVRLGDGM